jgi:uncharacterized tellurite resistance protein B-like protein
LDQIYGRRDIVSIRKSCGQNLPTGTKENIMRHYPSDSPEAMGRIVALALMADGAIDPSELRLLDAEQTITRIGLDAESFDRIFYEFCTDMLGTAHRVSSGQLELDAETIDLLLDEVRQPQLQVATLRTMLDIVHADDQLAGSEAVLISRAMTRWSLDLHQVYTIAASKRQAFSGITHRAAHV